MTSSIMQVLGITRSSLLARLTQLDVVSHNLANINTAGFKTSRTSFQEMLDANRLGGVEVSGTARVVTQGVLLDSDNPLDLAISGEGYFALRLSDDRTGYTRGGQFRLDANRDIVDANGHQLIWSGTIPEDSEAIHVNPDGGVFIARAGTWEQAGTIELSTFTNQQGLLSFGQNLWLVGDASGDAQTGNFGDAGFGQIYGNSIEQSNVDMTAEMTRMITLQRAFEMSIKSFEMTDTMIGQAIQMRR